MSGSRRPGLGDTASRYCSHCGTGLERSMRYCPDCGTPNDRSSTGARVPTDANPTGGGRSPGAIQSDAGTTDRDLLEHRIARASREGWKLEHDFGDHAVVVRRTFGSVNEHLAVALVTVWFTMGIGNALWGAYRYFGDAERRVLRADRVEGREAAETRDDPATGSALLWRASAGFCWLLAAIVAVIGLEIATATTSLVLFALAALFATLGVSALPSVRRRLEGRRSIAANGRVRSVEERSVVAPDGACSACSGPVGRGVERTYRTEFCVLGVPLTADEGRNYYCRRCADGNGPATTGARADVASEREASAVRSASDPKANLDPGSGADSRTDLDPGPEPGAETDSESTRG